MKATHSLYIFAVAFLLARQSNGAHENAIDVSTGPINIQSGAERDSLRRVYQLIEQNYLCAAATEFNKFKIDIAPSDAVRATERILQRMETLSDEQIMACLTEFVSVMKSIPGGGGGEFFLMERGKALLYEDRNPGAALKYFNRLTLSYPNGRLLPWIIYYSAECNRELDNTHLAIKSYDRLIKEYPTHSLSAFAQASRNSIRINGPKVPKLHQQTTP